MRFGVVGGGLAGALLAWRLAQATDTRVDVIAGEHTTSDATAASGGIVRAYESDAEQRGLAFASLTELFASPLLREWSGYYEVGSTYVRAGLDGMDTAVSEIEQHFPGSARIVAAEELETLGWFDLPDGATAIVERAAGAISPERLRQSVLTDLRGRSNVRLRAERAGSLVNLSRDYDALVLAVGAWTPDLLRDAGLATDAYRGKSIQYTVYETDGWRPTTFVDDITGLYGKPTVDGGVLIGVPTDQWDVDPGRGVPTSKLHEAAVETASKRFRWLRLGSVRTRMNATDCYTDPPILRLRRVGTDRNMFTFTGGSGGAAKTALAASARAADELVSTPS